MNSITNVVEVKYGPNDVPQPGFSCPVVVDPKLLKVLQGTSHQVGTIVDDAACAVELVSRFEGATRYVDFSPQLALAEGELPIAMRVKLVKGQLGEVAQIGFRLDAGGLH